MRGGPLVGQLTDLLCVPRIVVRGELDPAAERHGPDQVGINQLLGRGRELLCASKREDLADSNIDPRHVLDNFGDGPPLRCWTLRPASAGHALDLREEGGALLIQERKEGVG